MNVREFVAKIADSAAAYPDPVFSTPRRIYTCVNPYSYHIVRKHAALYAQMDGLFVDGMTMCWWIRLLWRRQIPRLSFDMSGMAVELFSRLNGKTNQDSIYFIGARQEQLQGSIEQMRKTYPDMRICGFRNGYFADEAERTAAIRAIVETNTTYTVIGMGSPLQEQFALDLKEAGYQGIAFTCGGFLHQTSTKMTYYPEWVNRYNLRAFYRLFHEKGMARRLLNVLVGFPILFSVDSFLAKYIHKY